MLESLSKIKQLALNKAKSGIGGVNILERFKPFARVLNQSKQDDERNKTLTLLALDRQRRDIFKKHSSKDYLVSNYNFGPNKEDRGKGYGVWATNPKHVELINSIYKASKEIGTPELLDQDIKRVHPNSPITAKMIFEAANKHDVDPLVMYAEMRQDSGLGTVGERAIKNKNPGNIGNTDEPSQGDRSFKKWEDGVDAVAQELAARELNRGLKLLNRRSL